MIRLILFLILSCSLSHAQDLRPEIRSLFDFKPSQTSEEVMKKKNKELDAFWDKVKKDTAKYLPSLRRELLNNDNPPFFYSDCSKLLLKLSDTRTDQEIALQALAKCDIAEAQKRDYLFMTQWLALKGHNTVPLAFRILDYPKFKVFIPEHYFTFGVGDCFLFAILSNQRNYFLPLIQKAYSDFYEDESKRVILFRTLWYAIDCNTDSIVKVEAQNDTLLNRYYANLNERLIINEEEMTNDKFWGEYIKQFKDKDFEELDIQRRKRVMGLSDEMIQDLDLLNFYMRKRRDCR